LPLRSVHIPALFLLLCIQSAFAGADTWPHTRFHVERGTVLATAGGLSLAPNEQGQILLELEDARLTLSDQQRASFSFDGAPPDRIYLIWRYSGSDQLYQHGFPTLGNPQPQLELTGVSNWSGRPDALKIGFLAAPGTQVTLLEMRLAVPGWHQRLQDAVRNWSAFRPWRPTDINLHTGTRELHQGPHPMPAFALCCLVLTVLYGLIRRRRANWRGAAVIILACWLSLDAFWQWRLWQQVDVTRARFAGLDSEAKVLASKDAAIAGFVRNARRHIDSPDARVFVASQSDGSGMRAAYYLSPLNTYWHRNGPELPPASAFQPGDHILIVAPSALAYNAAAGSLRLPGGDTLPVIERQAGNSALLLEVSE